MERDLTLITDLLRFVRESEVGRYHLPSEFKQTFSLLKLADFLGLNEFLEAVSADTCVPVQLLDNLNPINVVRGALRAACCVPPIAQGAWWYMWSMWLVTGRVCSSRPEVYAMAWR